LESQTLFSGFAAADRARRIYFLLVLILIALVAIGCGAPAEPGMRRVPIPESVQDLSVRQSGNNLSLSFTLPKDTMWHEPLQSPLIMEIYREFSAAAPVPANNSAKGAVARPATLLVTIPAGMAASYLRDGKVRFVDTIPSEVLAQHAGEQDIYVVRTRASKKKSSGNSNLVSIPIYPPAEAVHDLAATLTADAVVLQWTPVLKTTAGGALAGAASYRVYRSSPAEKPPAFADRPADADRSLTAARPSQAIAPASAGNGQAGVETAGLTLVGDTPAPPFRDAHFEFGRDYLYSVRSVVIYPKQTLESADSNLLRVTPKDTFPPAAPQGVQSAYVPADGETPAHVELSWSINGEPDLAGYSVYRSEEGTSPVRLNPDSLLSPAFRDMSALSGHTYRYIVTAVDQAGNESPPSSAVLAQVPETNNEEK